MLLFFPLERKNNLFHDKLILFSIVWRSFWNFEHLHRVCKVIKTWNISSLKNFRLQSNQNKDIRERLQQHKVLDIISISVSEGIILPSGCTAHKTWTYFRIKKVLGSSAQHVNISSSHHICQYLPPVYLQILVTWSGSFCFYSLWLFGEIEKRQPLRVLL